MSPPHDARGRQDVKRKAPPPGHVERAVFRLTAHYASVEIDVGAYTSREKANEAQKECRELVLLPNGKTLEVPNYFSVKEVIFYEPLDGPERKRAREVEEGASEAAPERVLLSVDLVRNLKFIVSDLMDVDPWPAPFKELQDVCLPEERCDGAV